MQIIEHFSCYTKLPIKLSDIAEHVIEQSSVDKLYRAAVDVPLDHLKGIYRQYHHKPPYVPGGEVVGEVLYNVHLGPFDQRFVQCKEMLHAFDSEPETASEIGQVEQLVRDIIVPLDVLVKMGAITDQALSDNGKVFPAIAVLLPRDFLNSVRPLYKSGQLSVGQIAQYAKVPSEYVRFALRDDWAEILDTVT